MKINSKKGQVIIEAILLVVVSLSLWVYLSKAFIQGQYMQKLIEGPWPSLAGMIESGVWDTPSRAKVLHPNSTLRVATPLDDE